MKNVPHFNTEKMKDFDLEKLERKNIYRTPEHFFEEMQANVLRGTALPAKEAKVIKLNWAYAAAAAVVMLFGVTFFLNQGQPAEELVAEATPTRSQQVSQNTVATGGEEDEAVLAYRILNEDLTSVAMSNQTEEAEPRAIATKANPENMKRPTSSAVSAEVQVDQILSTITTAELADLGKNAEQDVYLDLYY